MTGTGIKMFLDALPDHPLIPPMIWSDRCVSGSIRHDVGDEPTPFGRFDTPFDEQTEPAHPLCCWGVHLAPGRP